MAIGYACKLIGVAGTSISGCILKNCSEERLKTIISKNIQSLGKMIEYNTTMNIKLFRISSDIIPFGSHPVNKIDWCNVFKDELTNIGKKISAANIRVSMHPGQYTVLNSDKIEVVERAIAELDYHRRFLDALDLDKSHKLVLHIGGTYGDKETALHRFAKEFRGLSDGIKERLVIENDDKSFNIEDVLKMGIEEGIPVVFDNLHNTINRSQKELEDREWIKKCSETWDTDDGKQKMHYSQQRTFSQQSGNIRTGAHSDSISIERFLEYYIKIKDLDVDIMVEVKDKNLSAVKCINVIEGLNGDLETKALEEEWARYKYLILSKSNKVYNLLRQLLKNKEEPDCIGFYRLIEEGLASMDDIGSQINAIQHIWGYLNNQSIPIEEKRYNKLLESYKINGANLRSLKNHLLRMAKNQNQEYLVKSLYFYSVG